MSAAAFPLGTFPQRTLPPNSASAYKSAVKFFTEVYEDGYEWPRMAEIDSTARWAISEALDASMHRVYNDLVPAIVAEPEHLRNYRAVKEASRLCGKFTRDRALLCDTNPFEQMLALSHVILADGPRWKSGNRTLCFGIGDDKVLPIYVMRRGNTAPPHLMQVMLGAGTKSLKPPTYSELASNTAGDQANLFVPSLNALEVMRQPFFSAATVMKVGMFAMKNISAEHRYGIISPLDATQTSHFACVELPGQNLPRNAPIKERSAATNLCHLVKHSPGASIGPAIPYEQFAPEGYKDDASLSVTPRMLLRAVGQSIVFKAPNELDALMEQIFVSSIVGRPQSDRLAAVLADRIFHCGAPE